MQKIKLINRKRKKQRKKSLPESEGAERSRAPYQRRAAQKKNTNQTVPVEINHKKREKSRKI